MKIHLITPALAAILGLALASAPVTAQAQTSTNMAPATSTAPVKAKAKKSAKNPDYSGSITAISATSVTVANTKRTLTLAISPTTKFKKDKVVATLADFAVGDKVSGSYTTDATGAMTAYSMHKKTAKSVAKTAASSTPATATPATPAAQ